MDYAIERSVEGMLGDGFAEAIPEGSGGVLDGEGDDPVPRGSRH